jgi:hypothetical protein
MEQNAIKMAPVQKDVTLELYTVQGVMKYVLQVHGGITARKRVATAEIVMCAVHMMVLAQKAVNLDTRRQPA